MRGGEPAASAARSSMPARTARAAGESTRGTVGVELKSTGVAQAGQNAAPSGNSRAHEEHFIRKFRSGTRVASSYAAFGPSTTNLLHMDRESGERIEGALRLACGLGKVECNF